MHILFADDEKNLQELMRTELPRMGYSVDGLPRWLDRRGGAGKGTLRLPDRSISTCPA